VTGLANASLPENATLAEVAVTLEAAGWWGAVFDDRWHSVYVTSENVRMLSGLGDPAPVALGTHVFGREAVQSGLSLRFGFNTPELLRESFLAYGPIVLADTPGGRDELRSIVDPLFSDLIDELEPVDVAATTVCATHGGKIWDGTAATMNIFLRIRDAQGALVGTAMIGQPAVTMTNMAALTSHGDVRHLELMQHVAKAGRRPAAILFADLDGSTPLAKRLPTPNYFSFCRRFVRVADTCVIDNGGLIGRHAGDGVVAFFLAETAGSESAAAHACISAARSLQLAIREVAERSDLKPADVILRFGLHWGGTVYVGQLTTPGRTEVASLGEEVNEAARIEACASGGRILASKALIERLESHDANQLTIDAQRLTYTQLADLPSATDKARRDAPAIAVCDLGNDAA
jgi:class 3 adenylate cyclase